MNGDLMGDVWENSPAKGAELILLLTIAYFADDEGFASETANTLAGKARMSTDSVYRATVRLEEKGLLKVLQRGEGRTPSRYQLPRSGRSLRPQGDVFELRDRNLRPQEDCACGRKLRPQDGTADSWPQTAATSGDGSSRNLRPQNASSPQSAATTDAPKEGTRAGADARVGGLEGRTTTPPTNPPTATDRANAHEPIDKAAFDFIADLDLKRTPLIAEQREIAALFAAKIAAGFTRGEIENSVGGDWDGARNRVRTLIWRLKQMPELPLRRTSAGSTPPKPQWECAACNDPVVGPVTVAARCPICWNGALARSEQELAGLTPGFKDDLLAETRKHLEANGWRPEGAVVTILAAELMKAHDVPARAKQVLGKWDRQRAEAERQARGGAA